jgi:hypothetical protein
MSLSDVIMCARRIGESSCRVHLSVYHECDEQISWSLALSRHNYVPQAYVSYDGSRENSATKYVERI